MAWVPDNTLQKTFSFMQGADNPGIVTNLPTTQVAWSTGLNVRQRVGCVYKSPGRSAPLATVTNGLQIRAMFTFKGGDNVWRTLVCCDTKIYSYTNNFGTVVNITPATPPSSTATDVWQFAMIGGMPVLSNGVNTMWKWDLTGNPMTVVSGAPQICKALHVHQNKLIVGNIQEGAYSFTARLRWANTMQPNGGWTTDLRGLSGGKDLVPHSTTMQGTDAIQAITSQGDKLIVLCERNIWYGTPAEWPLDYNWAAMDSNLGLIAPRAFVKTPKGLIYFMGQDDFHVIADGVQDIGFGIRNSVFPVLNKSSIKTAFAYYKPSTREVYFCVATGSNTIPDMVFIYNEETKGWMFESCCYLSHAFQFDSTNYTWDSADTLPWTYWDDPAVSNRWENLGDTGVLPYEVVGTAAGQIQKADTGFNNSDGTAMEGYIETGDFVLDNTGINKIIHEIVPILKPQDTVNALMIQVGTRENLHKDIEWSTPQVFTIGVSRHVNFRKMGKYFRIRFITDLTDSPWALEGFACKYSFGGSR